jgi:iduronate 2-sulfatase
MLDDPKHTVRKAAFSVAPMRKGFLLREDKWAFIQYGETGKSGMELYNMKEDPKQYTSLAKDPAYQKTVTHFKAKMADKLLEVRTNDLKKN